jgi:exosome complex RNA-binding protein Rrp4
MTAAQAKALLSGPLVFGDTQQIEARRFLEAVDVLVEKMKRCDHDHGFVCDMCEGQDPNCTNCRDGWVVRIPSSCLAIDEHPTDVTVAALWEIRKDERGGR